METLEFGDLGTWKSRNEGSNKSHKYKFSKFKSVLPKMSARSGLAEKRPRGPHLGRSQDIFFMDQTKNKMYIL